MGEKAKSFWNDEVIGAKKAMERNAAAAPGKDVTRDLQVTLEEAVLGAKKSLSFGASAPAPPARARAASRRPSSTATSAPPRDSSPRPRSHRHRSPGVADGATLRLKDQGDDGDPRASCTSRTRRVDERGRHHRPRRRGPHHPRVVVRFPERGEPTSVRVRTVEGEWGISRWRRMRNRVKGSRFGTRRAAKPGGDERGDLFVIERVVYEDERAEEEEETDAEKDA